MRDGHSSWTPVTRRLQQPTRTADLDIDLRRSALGRAKPRAVPIRSCSRWGLPCRRRCRRRGALLPHPFHPCRGLRNAPRRSVLCGTFPRLAPAGCYPAPLVHGARTFLPGNLSVSPKRPSDRLTLRGMGSLAFAVKRPRGDRDCERARKSSAPGRSGPAALATWHGSTHRQCRRLAPAGNGAERRSRRPA